MDPRHEGIAQWLDEGREPVRGMQERIEYLAKENEGLLVIENPTNATWEDTYAILVRPTMTLWQAVALVDPTFPTTGPGGPRGRRNPWPRVPDQLLLVRAIRYAASWRLSRARIAYLTGSRRKAPERAAAGPGPSAT